jgi:ABC-type sugar transport system ATPase subunit
MSASSSEIQTKAAGTGLPPALEARGVSKHFGGVQALYDVSFCAEKGEVHALLGANGAGKSTLVKILSGAIRPDRGEVRRLGERVELHSPADAMRAGVTTVHQERSLLPDLTVTENIVAASLPQGPFGVIDRRGLKRSVRRTMDRIGLEVDPQARVEQLSLAEQQMVEISRALYSGGAVVILDEPNSALSGPETDRMLATIRRLAEQEIAVILVSHRLEEVFSVAHQITVLRDGQVRGTWERSQTSMNAVVRAMVGDFEKRAAAEASPPTATEPVLELDEIVAHRLGPVSLSLRRGEIVVLVGLEGSGTDATLRVAGGAIRSRRGKISINGNLVRLRSPGDAISHGVVYLPPDRKTEGLWLEYSLERNIAASTLHRVAPAGIVSRRAMHRQAQEWIKALEIGTGDSRTEAGALSGGNQQRLLFARCLAAEPKVLLATEPTRGVDVAAKAAIHALLRDLAREGLAVCIASSEFDEILDLADRLVCMRGGRVVAEGPASSFSKESLLEVVGTKS